MQVLAKCPELMAMGTGCLLFPYLGLGYQQKVFGLLQELVQEALELCWVMTMIR
jgi:hypothetical protein